MSDPHPHFAIILTASPPLLGRRPPVKCRYSRGSPPSASWSPLTIRYEFCPSRSALLIPHAYFVPAQINHHPSRDWLSLKLLGRRPAPAPTNPIPLHVSE